MRLSPAANHYRDAWAAELTAERTGSSARVAGWVHRRRDHGGLIFIDLRDRSGLVQLVFHPESAPEAHAVAHGLRSEDVITVFGLVVAREPENVNPNLVTGEIELDVSEITLLADADTPPFPVDDDGPVDENLRLRHRALDLRRAPMQEALALRHRVVQTMRRVLDERDFLEIETPFLTRSTPEGARDFLVPARTQPGSFYALPQSPQLFKQLLMVGGMERYYQIVRCFRDEDSRADRMPEFTQLDVEMAFITSEQVIELTEAVLGAVFEREGFTVPAPPWDRITHEEAMRRFGSDRPDRRFGLELTDLSEAVRDSGFQVFAGALAAASGAVLGLNAGPRELPRSDLDVLTEFAKGHGARGLVWAFVQEDGSLRSPIAKFLSQAEIDAIKAALSAKAGDALFVVADTAGTARTVLGALRLELSRRFALVPPGAHDIHWVVRFPMFAPDGEGGWTAEHHPFTAPIGDDLSDPATLLSDSYDIVLDGFEIGGGSIRINRREIQQRVFEIIGLDEQEAQARFGFLLDALRYGAPPHGGIAPGVDRIVALIAGRENIREVIAFPKATSGADPLTGAPAPVDDIQLRELGLRLR
ncbi:aspartate--tRNA ligase [Conexibacter sp. S30A1]|uniref:aspartate--tRNA ligase n=1 Tax=Conexibacter sp. S30A1 TaxID=2937800 RepID=UPI00200D4AB2|nr:aspartate--tRNA ligase [Conexibacter sp. S30A1]